MNEAQKHRRKAVDVHCNDAENDRCSCCIFSFCKQQTQTEFAFCKTELPLHFNSVSIILIGNLLFGLAVCILLRSPEFLPGEPDAEIAALLNFFTMAIDLIDENTLRIMSGAFHLVCNRSFQHGTLVVGIEG